MKAFALQLLLALTFALSGFAAEKQEAGPNGGRVIHEVKPALEFFVTKDRKVEITALSDDHKTAIKPAGQIITVTAGDRSKPTKLEFKEEGGKLVSTSPLPEGDGYPVSVGIKADAKSKAVYEKFNLDLSKCPTCKLAEYACTCSH